MLSALVLSALDNLKEHLENPFDQIGQDDVMSNAEKFMDRLAADSPDPSMTELGAQPG